jgi:hypothetical protein
VLTCDAESAPKVTVLGSRIELESGSPVTIEIFDLLGKRVYCASFDGLTSVSNLERGTYLLRIIYGPRLLTRIVQIP